MNIINNTERDRAENIFSSQINKHQIKGFCYKQEISFIMIKLSAKIH
jgi:hypothetical protein